MMKGEQSKSGGKSCQGSWVKGWMGSREWGETLFVNGFELIERLSSTVSIK